ncbi:PLP-dependent aspartate aminotransferase family protein [Lentilactobacillus sp. Marseille-Q4993]|uniref:trans-sulfuration enzyme family protein n=1 Tax=Lentilactobacillus sp. Marseille-Q4993 TaxID=3039492 RepID=UPI0024BC33CB|nr:PLP-dependent aspartate aminotransferase family protein [Lentilactobacillus sp. Marseille-Q4993]
MTNKIDTILAQAGNRDNNDQNNSISTPLYFGSNFRHDSLEEVETSDPTKRYSYSRLATPTRSVLQKALAELEGGVDSFAVSSGMAAIQLVFSLFKSGDHIITSDDLYGGSFRYFDYLSSHYGIKFSKWDGKDVDELKHLVTKDTKAIWLETPSNPTMKIIDIAEVSNLLHSIDNSILVCVDNTFLTPIYQRPLTLGADIVVHSATKYLSGHNDLLGGVVVAKDKAVDDDLLFNFNTTGVTLDPFDSWLLLRSLKTLSVRMERHTKNARYLCACLKKFDSVQKVLYPGVGGMISFYVNDDKVAQLLDNLKVISFAESLGGIESLVTLPAKQTHSDMTKEARLKLGITDNLIRLSVGLEDPRDLVEDIRQALGDAPIKLEESEKQTSTIN